MQKKSTVENQRLIVLTGGIGSGKTQVSDYLLRKMIPVEDADHLVHQLLKEDLDLKKLIVSEFGTEILTCQQEIDRKQLASIIFKDPLKRKVVEAWIHPRVRSAFLNFRKNHKTEDILVEVIPLLFESNLENLYPEVWMVSSPLEQVLKRLQENRNFSLEDALARIKNQMPLQEKKQRLFEHLNGHLIENSGSLDELYAQVDKLLQI